MDVLVFLIFALTANYCFIDGCRSKETSVKINVSNDLRESKSSQAAARNFKELANDDSYESAPANANTAYMIYPYSYPAPSNIYYPTSNSENMGYFQQSEFLPSQFVPSPPLQIQSVQPQVVANQPAPTPAVPLSMVIQSEAHQPFPVAPLSNQQHFQTVIRNPVEASQIEKHQNIPGVSDIQSDPQNYQQGFGGRPPAQYNPCQNKNCRHGSKCVVRRNSYCQRCPLIAVCVDPCETVRCAEGHVCQAEVGSCGTPFCEPRAICKDLCQGVVCRGNDTCTLVSLPSPSNYNLVPICGRDPCETTGCPLGQGCYLQEQFCSKPPCTVEPVCRDPCKGVVCGAGEFCYTEDVTCIKAPCNPITVCKNPCASVLCPNGQQCVLEQAFCIRTPCNPIATCKPF